MMVSCCLCRERSATITTRHKELYSRVRVLEKEDEQHPLKTLLIGADMMYIASQQPTYQRAFGHPDYKIVHTEKSTRNRRGTRLLH